MTAGISGWGTRRFPEIRIAVSTGSGSLRIVLSPLRQAATLSVLIAGTAALSWLGVSYIGYGSVLADKEAAVVHAESANADLQDNIAKLQDQLAAAAQERAQAQDRLAALTGQSGTLRGLLYTAEAKLHTLDQTRSRLSRQRSEIQQQLATASSTDADRIARLSKALEGAQRDLYQAEAQRATLAARLGKTEADRQAEEARYAQFKASYEDAAAKLQQLIDERDKAAHERDRLKARIGELEQKLSLRGGPGGATHPVATAGAQPTPIVAPRETALAKPQLVALRAPAAAAAPPHPETAALAPAAPPGHGLVAAGRRRYDQFERVLASTGVDVERLFAHFGVNRAEGGPFVPPRKGALAAETLSPEKLAALRGLVHSLPLAAPLASYRLESPFGPRLDPFNGRASFHTGVDMGAPYMTPIYATAPGTVTFAGYRDDYGKVVEIDHGNGISTVYAHMHRFIVSLGQRVQAHQRIGFVGSTGRASGPHVHYEVRVDGEPQDPEKFLSLARLIPVAAQR
jgi:murein DD-endopeptidase MepM/ murein hydrolase activator NlpD